MILCCRWRDTGDVVSGINQTIVQASKPCDDAAEEREGWSEGELFKLFRSASLSILSV